MAKTLSPLAAAQADLNKAKKTLDNARSKFDARAEAIRNPKPPSEEKIAKRLAALQAKHDAATAAAREKFNAAKQAIKELLDGMEA